MKNSLGLLQLGLPNLLSQACLLLENPVSTVKEGLVISAFSSASCVLVHSVVNPLDANKGERTQ